MTTMSDDLISRQAALRTNCFGDGHEGLRAFHVYEDYKKMRNYIESLPSAQPEIVRCKDCKHRDPEDKKCDCGHDILWQLPRQDDWYCADAERRTDDSISD